MNAATLLGYVSSLLNKHRVETILIGNAAAALDGAPVTTDDLDFLFRPTPKNIGKLEEIVREVGSSLTQPHYPLSHLYRFVEPQSGVQIDLMGTVYGVRSFESLRSRATRTTIDGHPVTVASLGDVIAMKRAANRKKDLAVLPVLEETFRAAEVEKKRP